MYVYIKIKETSKLFSPNDESWRVEISINFIFKKNWERKNTKMQRTHTWYTLFVARYSYWIINDNNDWSIKGMVKNFVSNISHNLMQSQSWHVNDLHCFAICFCLFVCCIVENISLKVIDEQEQKKQMELVQWSEIFSINWTWHENLKS